MADSKVNATEEQLKALEVFKAVIKSARGRKQFVAAGADQKADVFNNRRGKGDLQDADYNQLPEQVRQLLESLTEDELEVFARIDSTFVEAGLSVARNPRPLMIH